MKKRTTLKTLSTHADDKGKNLATFQRDELARDAVERCIEIVSEAGRRLPTAMKARRPEIPWNKVAAIGNVFRHEYDEISPPLVWGS